MGEIFLARQKSDVPGFERVAILKSLLPDLAEDRDSVEQFLDEARVAATLNHPNIIGVYEVGLWNGVYFMAMEYIDGEDLTNILMELHKQQQLMPRPIVARIIQDAALALDHAHNASDVHGSPLRIVHRDVSPHNIMVRQDGVTKVLDFGIAKAANRATRTATGLLKGKLAYMSPEQVRAEPLDHRSDQFSLGVVLWELLTSQRLFQADSQLAAMKRILMGQISKPSKVAEAVPEALERVAMRMLATNRDERYASCAEAAADLGEYVHSSSQPSTHAHIARFIKQIVGERIDRRTADLTPTDENFVHNLTRNTDFVHNTEFVRTQSASRPSNRRLYVVLAVVALVIAVVAGGLGYNERTNEPPNDTASPVGSEAKGGPPEVTNGELEVIEPPPKVAVLKLSSRPSGATIEAEGVVLGTTPHVASLAPDKKHKLRLSRSDFSPSVVEVVLEPGEVRKMDVVLSRRRQTSPKRETQAASQKARSGSGFLTLKTTPWTKIYIGGEPYGSTPVSRLRLEAGTHSVRLVNERAGVDTVRTVEIRHQENTKVHYKLLD